MISTSYAAICCRCGDESRCEISFGEFLPDVRRCVVIMLTVVTRVCRFPILRDFGVRNGSKEIVKKRIRLIEL